jgi:hypothetical protein
MDYHINEEPSHIRTTVSRSVKRLSGRLGEIQKR